MLYSFADIGTAGTTIFHVDRVCLVSAVAYLGFQKGGSVFPFARFTPLASLTRLFPFLVSPFHQK